MTDANALNRILTGVHSPGQFRYISDKLSKKRRAEEILFLTQDDHFDRRKRRNTALSFAAIRHRVLRAGFFRYKNTTISFVFWGYGDVLAPIFRIWEVQ
jgi:hypothetical protein